ncbi:glycerate kinase [Pandoraea thiooxydans]|uniref:Glycerate kinase n=1 Tax=Pandoraea thiooxydans TaxID=445709 RepID=A0A0G3EJK5_9BURK|nr:glycerate kinase [Pandoraea thiooxydans]AKJ67223.1 glycerate kinase [Pandoraea thiooxydans]APR94206.1 glycerate kinase [Pandoraea thiooxydans]
MSTPSRAPVIVIAPDSFKGSLSAADVAAAIAAGIARVHPGAEVRQRPMADGGEGTLDALLAGGGQRVAQTVQGAGGAPLKSSFGLLPDGTGVLESALVVSITDPEGMAEPVAQRSTVGLGEQLRAALEHGTRRILIGLGGSSTNDGGAGLLVGLGARLFDQAGQPVAPVPAELGKVASIDLSGLDARLRDCELVAMSDVNNPLCGPRGASAVFGPQKGVSAAQVETFDQAIARFAALAEPAFGASARGAAARPGAGAAGGLGFALQLLGATFRSGAEVVAESIGLADALHGADWLITGEGRSDVQTLSGKTPMVAAQFAQRAGVPATLLSGAVDRSALASLNGVFTGCFSLTFGPTTLDEAIANAAGLLADSAEQLTRLHSLPSLG